MVNSFNIQFYVRESKATRNGLAPLEMAININGKRKFINLPYKCLPSDFNRKKQPKELVDYQSNMRKRINEILSDMVASGEPLTADTLKDYIKNGGYKSYTVENLFEDYLNILKKRIGSTLTKDVYKKYERVRNLFFTVVNKNAECTVIVPAHVLTFKTMCENNYMTATAAGYLQKLKTVLTFAQDNGKLKINPFQGVKINKGTPKMDYLTLSEIEVLRNLDIHNTSLRNVRDIFLFQICSGLSYSDMKTLSIEDIREKDGVYYIKKNRNKTNVEYVSVLLPFVKNLFVFDNQGVIIGFCFKIISNQRINSYLHEIERLYNFPKNLHSHLARHSYAHLLLNDFGVRAETAARAMGHSSTKMTLKYYANISEQTTINEISSKFVV